MTNDIRVPVKVEESGKNKSKINPFAIPSAGQLLQTRNAHGWMRFPDSSDYTTTVTGGKETDLELQTVERSGSQERMVINQTKITVVSST